MRTIRQISVLALLSIRTLPNRAWQSLVIVAGMACVAGVLLSMLAMTEGMRRAYERSGDPRNVIIVSRGAAFEDNSTIPRDQARIIANVPGVARTADGAAIGEPVFVTSVPVQLKKNGANSWVRLRSFGNMGAALRPGFHMLAGRMFRPGTHELIAGPLAQSKFAGMALGDKVTMPDGQWPIVGIFATGDLLDGALVGDTPTVLQALRRNSYNSVLLRLASPGAFLPLRAALTHNSLLTVDVMRLPDWNKRINADTAAFYHVLIYGVSIILGVGAMLGCFNTMYDAVESRAREIATLRALGYGSFAIACSVILEASLLSITGALIGAAIAWGLYDGVQSSMGWDFFTLTVSPAMFAMAIGWALAVAFLGGFLPSLRAARLTVTEALRAV